MKNNIIIIILLFVLYLLQTRIVFSHFDNINSNSILGVIVEPRKHDKLNFVVRNVIEKLPSNSKIQIFHGTENKIFVKELFLDLILSGKIILTNLGVDNLSISDYNLLLTSKNFWKNINSENILIFQTDSCMCDNPNIPIEEFLKYDYVGAPWNHYTNNDIPNGGNGGFSLRKKSSMLKIIDNCEYEEGDNEDTYFCNAILDRHPPTRKCKGDFGIIPNDNISNKFSVEYLLYDNPIGVHNAWRNDKKKLKELIKNCSCINEFL